MITPVAIYWQWHLKIIVMLVKRKSKPLSNINEGTYAGNNKSLTVFNFQYSQFLCRSYLNMYLWEKFDMQKISATKIVSLIILSNILLSVKHKGIIGLCSSIFYYYGNEKHLCRRAFFYRFQLLRIHQGLLCWWKVFVFLPQITFAACAQIYWY